MGRPLPMEPASGARLPFFQTISAPGADAAPRPAHPRAAAPMPLPQMPRVHRLVTRRQGIYQYICIDMKMACSYHFHMRAQASWRHPADDASAACRDTLPENSPEPSPGPPAPQTAPSAKLSKHKIISINRTGAAHENHCRRQSGNPCAMRKTETTCQVPSN